MNCCTNTYDLGCFDSCDTITLPFSFEQNGTHKIQFETQFRFKYSITGVAGEDVDRRRGPGARRPTQRLLAAQRRGPEQDPAAAA